MLTLFGIEELYVHVTITGFENMNILSMNDRVI